FSSATSVLPFSKCRPIRLRPNQEKASTILNVFVRVVRLGGSAIRPKALTGEAQLGQGELLRGFSGRLEVLEVRGACSRREVVAWSGGNVKGSPVFAFFVMATTLGVAFLTRQRDVSHSSLEGDTLEGRDQMATKGSVATRLRQPYSSHCGGASALVTLMERIAHKVGIFYVVNVLSGLRVRGYETERLFLFCDSWSRFEPFEVCPGVGTVVTAVVACGVPEWWHSFGCGW
ncbi:hypothetical protein Taro_045099, partial [Colocasia esculenta]|nr:hypothetical protein [Colocasia esculenta]